MSTIESLNPRLLLPYNDKYVKIMSIVRPFLVSFSVTCSAVNNICIIKLFSYMEAIQTDLVFNDGSIFL